MFIFQSSSLGLYLTGHLTFPQSQSDALCERLLGVDFLTFSEAKNESQNFICQVVTWSFDGRISISFVHRERYQFRTSMLDLFVGFLTISKLDVCLASLSTTCLLPVDIKAIFSYELHTDFRPPSKAISRLVITAGNLDNLDSEDLVCLSSRVNGDFLFYYLLLVESTLRMTIWCTASRVPIHPICSLSGYCLFLPMLLFIIEDAFGVRFAFPIHTCITISRLR